MRLNRAAIEARLPHRGTMCLLDEVLDWQANSIRCRTSTHLQPGNPLRGPQGLGIACGIEYAAQAMALHAALVSTDGRPSANGERRLPAGALAAVREVRMSRRWLDGGDRGDRGDRGDGSDGSGNAGSDLIIEADLLAGDADRALYAFNVSNGAGPLLSGRATVVLNLAAEQGAARR